jgi:hypothetical protein
LFHNPPIITKEHIMPRFPTREADIAQLGKRLISGMRENAEDFPASPVGADEIEAYLAAFQEQSDAAASAQGTATEAVDAKGEALQTLTEGMRAVLRYAEDAVKYDRGKLLKPRMERTEDSIRTRGPGPGGHPGGKTRRARVGSTGVEEAGRWWPGCRIPRTNAP